MSREWFDDTSPEIEEPRLISEGSAAVAIALVVAVIAVLTTTLMLSV